jgi:uncharacterized protein (DUF488 family)
VGDRTNIWTIGHSNHDQESFVGLLKEHEIEFLVDVRSFPYSRYADHFNREEIDPALRTSGIRYVFMGEELGGRPTDEDHFDAEGRALYGLMASQASFLKGIDRLLEGARQGRLAIMCSCGKPDDCHRRLLVGKVLTERGVKLRHILPSGETKLENEVTIFSQASLFGEGETSWRSTQSVSHRQRLNTSSAA